jgi:hypothetical protein
VDNGYSTSVPVIGPPSDPHRYSYDDHATPLDANGQVWVYRGQRSTDGQIVTVRKGQSPEELDSWNRQKDMLTSVRGAVGEPAAVVEWLENFEFGTGMLQTLYGIISWVDGVTLAAAFAGRPPEDDDEARRRLNLLGGIVPVLEACDRLGYRYGDVKPENIVVTPDGRCVLIDPGCIGAGPHQRYESPPWVPNVGFDAVDVVGLANCVWFLLSGAEPGRDPATPTEVFRNLRSHLTSPPGPPTGTGRGPIAIGGWWSELMELIDPRPSSGQHSATNRTDPGPTQELPPEPLIPPRPPGGGISRDVPTDHDHLAGVADTSRLPQGSTTEIGSDPTKSLSRSFAHSLRSDVDYERARRTVSLVAAVGGFVVTVLAWFVVL